MRRTSILIALFLCVSTLAAAGERRKIDETFDWEPGQEVRVDFPVGELRVEAGGGSKVQVALEAECSRRHRDCEKALEKLRVESRSKGGRLLIDIEGPSSWRGGKVELEAVITVPRSAPLDVEVGVGALEVEGFENDVTIDLGVGSVEVWLPEAGVGSVSLDTGVGDASLRGAAQRVEGRRSLLIGAEVHWHDGPGDSRIRVDVGVGEITLRLE